MGVQRKARWQGVCADCGRKIEPGQLVHSEKQEGNHRLTCAPSCGEAKKDPEKIRLQASYLGREGIRDSWTLDKWRAMCQKILALPRAERDFDGLLPDEIKLYEEGRLDLVVQSIRERMTTSFRVAAEVYRKWKSGQPVKPAPVEV